MKEPIARNEIMCNRMTKFENRDPKIGDDLVIYVDGSYNPETKCGGSSVIVFVKEKDQLIKIYEAAYSLGMATSQRMEVIAMMKAIEYLHGHKFNYATIYSDSQYCTNSINKGWMYAWSKSDFHERANGDLWREIYNLQKKHYKIINVEWIRGHDGNEHNEYADSMANAVREFREVLEEKIETERKELKKNKSLGQIEKDMIGDMLDE